MQDFIFRGAIRYMPETGDLHIGKTPTPQQMRWIQQIVQKTAWDGTQITLARGPGVSRNFDYGPGTRAAQILADIRQFYGMKSFAYLWVLKNCKFARV